MVGHDGFPQKLPDGDEMAVLHDPEEMSFGIVKPASFTMFVVAGTKRSLSPRQAGSFASRTQAR